MPALLDDYLPMRQREQMVARRLGALRREHRRLQDAHVTQLRVNELLTGELAKVREQGVARGCEVDALRAKLIERNPSPIWYVRSSFTIALLVVAAVAWVALSRWAS